VAVIRSLCTGLKRWRTFFKRSVGKAGRFVFDFNIPTALKGWVGHAPQGRGALHIIIIIIYYYLQALRPP
jgi:hypothetical protein